ncbi:11093_t:CDS:2 [Funneliformis geosporum]|uniref:8423_t:CDS:1 n=1 Tax=Funneliformis geosporum TaxID=1117311 RepID=A0A9W4SJR3_9GLOM|nr:8423_t:CDS:2 [Funneliformis geosporum]CAI2180032.1 11093_t:CDS:2 [Funneliformis geosporum]
MILCLILGEEVTDRFIFNISIEMWTSMKISHLQDGIKEKTSLSVPAHQIKLWKVAISTKDMNDEKMKILINKSHESINVKEELMGELLDAEDSISSKIENVPADNHIHIIVESPKPTTDKKLILNLINNLPNTNDKLFTVPALSGDDTDTVIYNQIELLKQKKSVLIDYEGFTAWIEPNGSLLKINDKDRIIYRQVAGQKDVWCIVNSIMSKFNHDLIGKFIMVTLPKKKIIERFTKAQKSEKFYMLTWNINELYECQENLYKEVDHNLIEKSLNCGELISGDEFSYKLIHIKSDNESGTSISYTKAKCVFASKFNIAEMSVLREKMFEMCSHAKICKGGIFQVRELQQSNEETVTFENLVKEKFTNIKDADIKEKIYYQPVAKNYQSIDSYIHPN